MVHRIKDSGRYYASVAIHGRRTMRVAGFPQKKLTEKLGHALEDLAILRPLGERPDRELQQYIDRLPDRIRRRLVKLNLIDGEGPGGRSRKLEDVIGKARAGCPLGEFEQYLRDKGDTEGHARQQAARARRVLVTKCGFALLSDITAEPVLQALAHLREGGLAGNTSNAFRQACRALTRWLTREGRLPSDPLAHLERVSADSRSDRRALTAEEQARLVTITRSQPERGGLSGEARSVLYTLALQTGLRRGELLTLKRSSFDFDSDVPTVTVEHGHAKNRRTARIPLQLETVGVLRRFLAEVLPAALVFRDAHRGYRAADVLRYDLEAAGIPERTEAGRVDFHSLRVSFVTNMARAHVPLALAQKLARHCDPKLTSTIYSRFGFDEDAAAIAKLPSLADAVG